MYLLDTNHCSRIIQGNPGILQQFQKHSEAGIATSVIVCGELRYMARKSEQRQANSERVEQLIRVLDIYPINEAIATIYGDPKGDLIDHFGPRDKARRRKFTIENIGISDNDLWIAATAICYGLTVVSIDSDFQRIKTVARFSLKSWL